MSNTDDVYDGTRTFMTFEELLAFFEVDSDEDLLDYLQGATYIEGDLSFDYDAGPVLILGTRGTSLEFPMTLDTFWEIVNDLDDEYELESETDRD